jgi:hypothetical protein
VKLNVILDFILYHIYLIKYRFINYLLGGFGMLRDGQTLLMHLSGPLASLVLIALVSIDLK